MGQTMTDVTRTLSKKNYSLHAFVTW